MYYKSTYEKNLPIQFAHKALELLEPNGKLIVVMPSIILNKSWKRN